MQGAKAAAHQAQPFDSIPSGKCWNQHDPSLYLSVTQTHTGTYDTALTGSLIRGVSEATTHLSIERGGSKRVMCHALNTYNVHACNDIISRWWWRWMKHSIWLQQRETCLANLKAVESKERNKREDFTFLSLVKKTPASSSLLKNRSGSREIFLGLS